MDGKEQAIMDDVNQDSFMGDLKDESLEKAKELAPWRADLPWWVVLIEGAVLLVIGFLILINPEQTSVNVCCSPAAKPWRLQCPSSVGWRSLAVWP